MHDTALRIGRLAIEIYAAGRQARILEIGSYDVNGSLRGAAPVNSEYVGIDLEAGPGVDIVTKPGDPLPVPDESFDLVLASSVLEHDPAFWTTFVEMARKVRRGGYLYINVPSNGAVHRYPEDHWRFYPDSGLALARWAESQGQLISLLESFTANRENDIWNDFVAVFRKGKNKKKPTRYLHQLVDCNNIRVAGATSIIDEQMATEDMKLVSKARLDLEQAREAETQLRAEAERAMAQVAQMADHLEGVESASATTRSELEGVRALAEERLSLYQASAAAVLELEAKNSQGLHELEASQTELREMQTLAEERLALYQASAAAVSELENEAAKNLRDLEDSRSQLRELQVIAEERLAELTRLGHRLADLESALAQRQEEVAQAEAALVAAHGLAEELQAQIDRLEQQRELQTAKLAEADAWVFQLAGDRRNAEMEAAAARREAQAVLLERDRIDAAAQRERERAESLARLLSDAEAAKTLAAKSHADELAGLLVNHNAALEALKAEIKAAEGNRAAADQARLRAELAREQAQQELAERFTESAMLTRLLLEREEANERELATREWLREVHAVLATRPQWWSFMPRAWQTRRDHRRLAARGLFDAAGYLQLYPDVAAARMDPLRHYILHGMNEGRRLTR